MSCRFLFSNIIVVLTYALGACSTTNETNSYLRSAHALQFSFESMARGYSGAAPSKCSYRSGEITYLGNTSLQLVNCLLEAPPKVDRLIITSPGGNVEHALMAAFIIRNRSIGVQVVGWCASSCANYILPAATGIHLDEHSVVYVHGAPKGGDREQIESNWPRDDFDEQSRTYDEMIDGIVDRANLRKRLHDNFATAFFVGIRFYELGDIYEYQSSRFNDHHHSLIVVDPVWLKSCLPRVSVNAVPPDLDDIAKLFPNYKIVTFSRARGVPARCFEEQEKSTKIP